MAKYGPKAHALVEREMKEMKAGKLRSGGSGAKVNNPKQAIAIALSEARREGAKIPPPPPGSASASKTAGKKAPTKKAAPVKAAAKKAAPSRKAAPAKQNTAAKTDKKKSAAKKNAGRS